MTRRPLHLGGALVVLYAVVALATGSWAPGQLRPLFDGFASHPGGVYAWITPPKEFAKGNRPPDSAQARIAFAGGGSAAVVAETPDGQVMASLPAAAVAPHPFDASARLEVRPLDSTTLGPLPAGLRPESNAYQVTIAFLPTGDLVAGLAAAGTVGLTAAAPADTLLFAADGRTWRQVEAKPLNKANAVTAPLSQTGYYLAASRNPPRAAGAPGGGAPVALFVVAAAVPLILGYLLLGRRRQGERSANGVRSKAKPTGKATPKGTGRQGSGKQGTGKTETGRAGPNKTGTGRTGTGKTGTGTGKATSGRTGTGKTGTGKAASRRTEKPAGKPTRTKGDARETAGRPGGSSEKDKATGTPPKPAATTDEATAAPEESAAAPEESAAMQVGSAAWPEPYTTTPEMSAVTSEEASAPTDENASTPEVPAGTPEAAERPEEPGV